MKEKSPPKGRTTNLRVAINARLLASSDLRGWNRYTVNLLAALPEQGVELFLYSDAEICPDHLARLRGGSYQVRVARPMKYLRWEQRWLPAQCRKDAVDVFHSPFNFGIPWSNSCPQVLTLHDAIGERFYGPATPLKLKLRPDVIRTRIYHRTARLRADRIIAPSEFTRTDLVKYLRLPAEKITVIHEAADANFTAPAGDAGRVRRTHGLEKPYVFYVGGWEERKNIPFLVRAFAAAELDGVELVLAGGKDDQRAELLPLAETLGVRDTVRLLGWVDEADLPALYAEAVCFVYPSSYEGFGLQLCEAMAVGTPVLAARATCLPEILGDGGETFSLENTAELTALLKRIATEPAFRAGLAERGRRRSAEFSWTRTAVETVAVYQQAIGGAGAKA
jgi:glycosyltransferase involved in cell wall biosynthesis